MATKTNRSYAEYQAEIQALQERAEAARKAEIASVVSRMREAINTYGLSAEDLGFRMGGRGRGRAPAKSAAKTVGVAKYMDPKSGKTWTGRGKPPTWIVGAKNRDDFLIKGAAGASSAASTSTAAAKPKALRAGAGVAKYQDPKSGKTWTGMGKPPAWIAGAKNRDDFLIGAKPAAAEGATAKKAARPAVARKGAGSTKVRSFKKSAQKLETRRGKKGAAPAKTGAEAESASAAA